MVCSLTVNRVDRNSHEISVDLIPETLRLTTWASVQVGDAVNYEIDPDDTDDGGYLRKHPSALELFNF